MSTDEIMAQNRDFWGRRPGTTLRERLAYNEALFWSVYNTRHNRASHGPDDPKEVLRIRAQYIREYRERILSGED